MRICPLVGQRCGARLGLVACVGPWVSLCPWDVGAVVCGELLGFRAPCTSPGPDSNRAQCLPGDTEQVLWDRGGQGSSRGAPRSLQSRAGLAVTHLAGAEQFGVCCASVTPAGDEYVARFFLLFFSPLGVEQQCVCWFINIEVLQSWGSLFLSRLEQQPWLLSISTLPALEEAGRERASPCRGGPRGVPTCSKVPSCPPGERRQPDSALGQSGGQGCLHLPSLQHPGGGRAHHAPARPR